MELDRSQRLARDIILSAEGHLSLGSDGSPDRRSGELDTVDELLAVAIETSSNNIRGEVDEADTGHAVGRRDVRGSDTFDGELPFRGGGGARPESFNDDDQRARRQVDSLVPVLLAGGGILDGDVAVADLEELVPVGELAERVVGPGEGG